MPEEREVSIDAMHKGLLYLLEHGFWPPELKTEELYARLQDDHDGTREGRLSICTLQNGDLGVASDAGKGKWLRFRGGFGGSTNPRTYRALLFLALAMKLDAKEKPDPEQLPGEDRRVGRLARDNVVETLRKKGLSCKTRVASEKEYYRKLIEKLRHEVGEFEEKCGHGIGDLNELINIYELVRALLEHSNCSWIYFEQKCREKKQNAGKYQKRIIVESVSENTKEKKKK